MDPELIRAVGVSLYGERWQAPLADALGVNLRNVQRWAAGEFAPSPAAQAGLLADMRKLVIARGRELDRVVAAIDEAAG